MYKKLVIFSALLFISPQLAMGDYFDDIKCDQHISTQPELKLVYTNITGSIYWYQSQNGGMEFGKVRSDLVNYLFVGGRFFGKVASIYGSENVNEVLRFFQRNHGGPHQRRVRTYLWLTNDKVIFVKRFSFHLAQAEIFCRELYTNIYGDSYEPIDAHF